MKADKPVQMWEQDLVLPTYPALSPDATPMFFEKRDVQRSDGRIYPNPFTVRLSDEIVDRKYRAVYLENEYLQVLVLPELGGRIFAGKDKTNGYDFFYRHKVIKPALIGLLGPWISGGVEFNWPQHHRPSTFMPVDHSLEFADDGSCTVWLSEHEPMNRTKGMIGVCLYPGKSFLETKVRLYNRTPFRQSFLWWENAAVHINDQYQVFFPPDVHYAAFHTKEFIVSYPLAKGTYSWGCDFGDGVDVSWYRNLEAATSFFAALSKYEFFGGYDHNQDAGVVHVANPFISPGKKFFTWGNGSFGQQWQKNLADDEGPYLELMAGAYTDNQPDFSWIEPFETRTFSQFWYPIQKIGIPKNANRQLALNLECHNGYANLGLLATQNIMAASLNLSCGNNILLRQTIDLTPGKPYLQQVQLSDSVDTTQLLFKVCDADGNELIRYLPEMPETGALPEAYQPPPSPEETQSVEQLFLIGLHLEQYRHPDKSPLPYWEEALRRDPGDARANNALGLAYLRQGDYDQSEDHFRRAIRRVTQYNFNPVDGEAYYNLGLCLAYQNRFTEAYAAFYKATWNQAWQSASYLSIAQIDCQRGDFNNALNHLKRSLDANSLNSTASILKAAVLRQLKRFAEAITLSQEVLSLDPLDFWARYENSLCIAERDQTGESVVQRQLLTRAKPIDAQTRLDVALNYSAAGLWREGVRYLKVMAVQAKDENAGFPMVYYYLGYFFRKMSDPQQARTYCELASEMKPDYCMPVRLEEIAILKSALEINPQDGHAHYYLGNILYDKKRYAEGIEHWELSCQLSPGFAMPWRNLGLAVYNLKGDIQKALEYYQEAFNRDPEDDRILYEFDQLEKRGNVQPEIRLGKLEKYRHLTDQRDDLCIELISLYNRLGRPEQALEILNKRQFHPWEGGEGMVSGQYSTAHWLISRREFGEGNYQQALDHLQAATHLPENLGESGFPGLFTKINYYEGLVKAAAGEQNEAREIFQKIATTTQHFPLNRYYQAKSLLNLGEIEAGKHLLKDLMEQSNRMLSEDIGDDYFNVSMPSPVFKDDLAKIRKVDCLFLAGMASQGLNYLPEAKEYFEEVLALDINHLDAYEELRRLP